MDSKQKSISTVFIASVAAIAGILFGYDVGIISGAILFIKQYFMMSPALEGVIVGAVPFGAFVASLCCGRLNDKFGRKLLLLITAILYAAGSIGSAIAANALTLALSRIILGLAVGLGSFSAPLYIAEIAGKNQRGSLVTLNQLAITIGICASYAIDYLFANHGAWRWMLGIGLLPAILLFCMAVRLPNSPRWLMQKGRNKEAAAVLANMMEKQEAEQEIKDITHIIKQEENTKASVFTKKYRKILSLGIWVSILTQAVGINAIIYYAPTVFIKAGLNHISTAILATMGIGLINVIFTIAAIIFVDKIGRRKLLIGGLIGIMLSLIALTASFSVGLHSQWLVWLTFISMLFFVAAQAVGTGPACWLIPSEIFPIKIRGAGVGISVAFNWLTNVVVGFLFPVILKHYGAAYCFGVFLLVAISAIIYFYFKLPETKNKSLEEIENELAPQRA